MISSSGNDDKIAWYKNLDGLGTFGPQQIISETVLGASSVFAADLDGDGDMDILAASSSGNSIGWFENLDGQGNFGPYQIISTLTVSPSSVYAFDADGDGDMDVFSASALDDKIAWYKNLDGQGNFGAQQVISTNFDYPLGIIAGDIDGDGAMDLLSGSRYNNSRVAWFKNTNGQGNFVEQQAINTDLTYCRSAILADVDGDGDLDIVAVSRKYDGDRVMWFENTDGQGNFSNTPHLISMLGDNANPETLYAADFNNDGKIDIAVGTQNKGLSWFKNNGSGNFGPQRFIDNDVEGVRSLFAADIDGDGHQDLLIAADRADRIAWHKNTNGQGDFGPANILAEINSANGVMQVVSADLDGDGDKDIISALSKDNRIAWQENLDGQGTFSELRTIANIDNPVSVFAGDLDGDGYIDLLVASSGAKVVWYKNLDGQANFGPEQIINTDYYPSVVYAVDIDNDGDLDVFASSGVELYWQENDGSGNFGSKNIIDSGSPTYYTSIFAIDIDNDGDKDLITASYGDGDLIAWYENIDGQGTFGPAQMISSNLVVPDSVYAADFDNDGDIDVIATSYGTNEVVWYENTDGQGTFGNEHIITSSAVGAYNVFAKDLDNDGNIDVICAAWLGNEVIYFLNDGSGNFNYQQTLVSDFKSANSVVADDFNGDGRIDILASAYAADGIIWFENKGPLNVEENRTSLFSIYPNPTTGLLNIKSSTSISDVTVYNNLGQLLITSEEKKQIDISTLREGIYFVKIKDENGQTETEKVVKK